MSTSSGAAAGRPARPSGSESDEGYESGDDGAGLRALTLEDSNDEATNGDGFGALAAHEVRARVAVGRRRPARF